MKSVTRRLAFASAAVAAITASSAVYAQDAADTPSQTDASPDAADEPGEVIVVTGSRTVRDGSNQPTPVQVVTTDDLIKTAPGNIADGLNQLPVFQNSISNNQQQFTQGNRQRTGNYLNLRALGTQRVLVLLDGQRLPQSGTNGGVDVNLVPQLLTQRVDVVTGGASAVYGSDAVSGVVNFVIDKQLSGLKAQAQYGISSRGDNATYRVGLAAGTSLIDDRLHLIASAERIHSDGLSKLDRPIIGRAFQSVGLGTAADPIRVLENIRFGVISDAGVVRSGALTSGGLPIRQFDPTGTQLIAFNSGTRIQPAGVFQGGDSALIGQACCTITPSSTATQLFGRATFEASESVELYVQGGYNWSENSDATLPVTATNQAIFRENAFLTDAQRTAIFAPTAAAPAGPASVNLGKIFNNRRGNTVTQFSNSLYVNAGVTGQIGSFRWDAGYVHGETKFRVAAVDRLNAQFAAAIDAVRDPAGNIVCRVTITNPGLFPGCVPLNPFGIGNESNAAYDYVRGVSRYEIRNTLDSFQASIAGDLFEGWAGPISVAAGGEYREQTLDQTTNSDPADFDTAAERAAFFNGLRGVQATDLRFSQLNIAPVQGEYNVKEGFVEATIPLLRDSSVGSAELNGAARVTDYSTSGTVTTWKVGAIYDPVESIRFRGSYSRDIRAPSLFELFSGQTISTLVINDSLTNNPTATLRGLSGGNLNLRPEIANTLAAGVVLKPVFIPGLTVTADYYNIKIKDAINTPYSAFEVNQLCIASNQTAEVCGQITRDPTTNQLVEIRTTLQNVSAVELSGVDVDAQYGLPLGEGRLNLRAAVNYLIDFNQQNSPTDVVREFAGTTDARDVQFPLPLPRWRANFNVGYDSDSFSGNVQQRLIGSMIRSAGPLIYVDNDIPAVWYTDLNLTFKAQAGGTKFEFFGTINNLFDKEAPLIPVTTTPGLTVPTIRSTYDFVGRYMTVGVRVRM